MKIIIDAADRGMLPTSVGGMIIDVEFGRDDSQLVRDLQEHLRHTSEELSKAWGARDEARKALEDATTGTGRLTLDSPAIEHMVRTISAGPPGGIKIGAIRLVREFTGAPLKDAKELVDRLWTEAPK